MPSKVTCKIPTGKFFVITCSVLLLLFFFVGQATAAKRTYRTVNSAEELEKALDDGVTDITISTSLRGNFTVPRWVYSISGANQNVTLTPADKSKPVFDAESAAKKNLVRAAEAFFFVPLAVGHALVSKSTAETLEFNDLTILCGPNAGIDADYLSKPVTIRGVTFKPIISEDENKVFVGCYPSTETNFYNCTFEGVSACINTRSSSDYNLNIRNCVFRNSFVALLVSKSGSNGKAFISACNGNVMYWTMLLEPGSSTMAVNIDQKTIDTDAESLFSHELFNDTSDDEQLLLSFANLHVCFSKLFASAQAVIEKEKERSWEAIRLLATGELQKHLLEISATDDGIAPQEIKKRIDQCVDMYALLAAAPISDILTSESDQIYSYSLAKKKIADILGNFVKDNNLAKLTALNSFSTNLGIISCASDRIWWGDTGNLQEAMASPLAIDSAPERFFRENIQRFQKWLVAMESVRGDMKKLQEVVIQKFSTETAYVTEFEKRLQDITDFGIASNQVAAVIFFDLPIETIFAANYARVMREKSSNRVMSVCRELRPFFSLS